MRVGSNPRTDQSIGIYVMKLLMKNMLVEVKGRFQCWKKGN